jgi:two-component system, NtrC family, nitrogen regulation sensor histidine kinase NtrY
MLRQSWACHVARYIGEWRNMIFNKFYWRIVMRVVLLACVLLLFSYCVINAWSLRAIYAGAAAVFLIAELIWFINKFARNINHALSSFEQHDFTIHFNLCEHNGEFASLYARLNKIAEVLKSIHIEKEVHHQHLETLVSHLNVGIMSFDEKGNIHLVNKAFLNFTRRIHLSEVSQLDPELRDVINRLEPARSIVMKVERDERIKNIGLHLSEFKKDNQHFKLVSVQDITNELTAGEMEAWQKLIRVLTHEIMNSITPIISLSNTLHQLTTNITSGVDDQLKNIHAGIEAIRNRSEGLQIFTKRYRELTQLPNPQFMSLSLFEVMNEVVLLYRQELDERRIKLSTKLQEGINIIADRALFQQAIINLLKNAIDAVDGIADARIEVTGSIRDHVLVVEIHDNGGGIDIELFDKIFIPFFTTKKTGSGIGLALARQIISLHMGQLVAENNSVGGATFRIIL